MRSLIQIVHVYSSVNGSFVALLLCLNITLTADSHRLIHPLQNEVDNLSFSAFVIADAALYRRGSWAPEREAKEGHVDVETQSLSGLLPSFPPAKCHISSELHSYSHHLLYSHSPPSPLFNVTVVCSLLSFSLPLLLHHACPTSSHGRI